MRRFSQVDVFTSVPGLGNPVAVVIDAEGLDDAVLARVANWTNLSETTFVLPPTRDDADYRVRIFTPSDELPFAGHPTLGTCRALLDAGVLKGAGPWVQECAAGLIPVTLAGDVLSFTAPAARVAPSPVDAEALGRLFGGVTVHDPLVLDVGPHWLTARVSPADLDALAPDAAGLTAALGHPDVTLYAVDEERVVHVRSFFPAAGQLAEDPVCGSGNAAVGAHLRETGRAGDVPAAYRSRQGRHRGRDGRITVTPGERVAVGGPAVTVVRGTIDV